MVTLAVGVAGGVAPVQIYTSYEVAVGAASHVKLADVGLAVVLPLAGVKLVTQAGGNGLMVKVLVLAAAQPVATPVPLRGAIYHLYVLPGVSPLAV